MVKLNFAAIKEGHSFLAEDVEATDIDLAEFTEFGHAVHIQHDLERVGNEVYIKTTLATKMNLICDVCLDSYSLNVQETIEIILTKDNELVERGEEDVYLVTDSTTEIDITDSLRQSLILAIPFKKTCRESCKGLCPTCGNNLNYQQCACSREKTDSRWDELRKITFTKE
ncbi:DUF177 domain-containing protein [candidate division KSB1 bacterium]|nr:DUF177 domain-containing protein [candidate division KSB1 bacterium]